MSINDRAPRRAAFDVPELPEMPSAADALVLDEAMAVGSIPQDRAALIDAAFAGVGSPSDANLPVGVDGVATEKLSRDANRVSSSGSASFAFPHPHSPRIFVVANQKGGVGKTTTAVNIAAALALGGLKVLVIDIDPQGNASTALGVEHQSGTLGTYEVLLEGKPIIEVAQPCPDIAGLYVVPATIDLAGAEIGLVSESGREAKLRDAIQEFYDHNYADYIFIDCPPSLGLLTLNALVAAREILIPIQCEYYALEGVTQLLNTINLVKGNLNDDLTLSTVLLTMFDGRTILSSQVAEEVRQHLSDETLSVAIPRSVRIAEAPSFGQTIMSYQPTSAGGKAYLAAAQEIAERGA